jgi:hypothetical protein
MSKIGVVPEITFGLKYPGDSPASPEYHLMIPPAVSEDIIMPWTPGPTPGEVWNLLPLNTWDEVLVTNSALPSDLICHPLVPVT